MVISVKKSKLLLILCMITMVLSLEGCFEDQKVPYNEYKQMQSGETVDNSITVNTHNNEITINTPLIYSGIVEKSGEGNDTDYNIPIYYDKYTGIAYRKQCTYLKSCVFTIIPNATGIPMTINEYKKSRGVD